jgi:hypothetical protein
MTIRVVQWATGAVGSAQLQQVIDHPDLELAVRNCPAAALTVLIWSLP